MENFMRRLLNLFYSLSALAVLSLVASLIGKAVFGGGPDTFKGFDAASAAFALATVCFGVFVARNLAGRLVEHHFDLEKALEEMHKLMKVIDASFDDIVLTDTHGIIRHVNPKWVSITGWSAEEVEGRMSPAILKSGYQDASFYSNLWLTIQNGKQFRGELINKRKDGGYYRVDEIVLPLKNGKLTGYAAFHHVLDADFKPASPPPPLPVTSSLASLGQPRS